MNVRLRMKHALAAGIALVSLATLVASVASPPAWSRGPAPLAESLSQVSAAQLPPEARDTLAAIRRGGPYRYRQDDSTFSNRERLLPAQARGHYREYTVVTPGSRDRGARRIVAGGRPPQVFYYTDDHYRTFRQIRD